MKTLYLDPFSGVAGDMLVGALLDLGLDFEQWQVQLQRLNITGYHLSIEKTKVSAINGTKFHVQLVDHKQKIDTGLTALEQTSTVDAHANQSVKHHHHHHGRNLEMITSIIETSGLSTYVKESAIAVFQEIAQAEAQVHGLAMNEVHFHEVGAVDSIVDIVGTLIAIEMLEVDQIVCGEIYDGTGLIQVAHGMMPVPVPAVMILRQGADLPMRQRADVKTELVTPTGLALLKFLVNEFGPQPQDMILLGVGYGFGSRETGTLNALRISLFDSKMSKKIQQRQSDAVLELHTNLDDETGEAIGAITNHLMNLGVYDVFCTPIFMKKNRPAYELTVILPARLQNSVIELLFRKTSTVGVRWQNMQRAMMERSFEQIETTLGLVQVKNFTYHGIEKFSFEFDDINQIAEKHHLTLTEVKQIVMQQIKQDKYREL